MEFNRLRFAGTPTAAGLLWPPSPPATFIIGLKTISKQYLKTFNFYQKRYSFNSIASEYNQWLFN